LKVGTACLTASEQKQSRKFSSGGSRERKLSYCSMACTLKAERKYRMMKDLLKVPESIRDLSKMEYNRMQHV
jgi:hypothetical protein